MESIGDDGLYLAVAFSAFLKNRANSINKDPNSRNGRSVSFLNLKNLSLMYVWQISNFALSFVLLPYLARVLEAPGFGIYSYIVGVNTYLWILVQWGFTTSAVRDVASNQGDLQKLEHVFWNIIYSKTVLIIVATATLVCLTIASDQEYRNYVFISGFLTILGAAVACDWFAQGVEKVSLFVIISVAVRLVLTILTILLVRSEADADLAAILHGLGGFFGGLAGFILITVTYKFFPKRQELVEIKRSISASFSLFLARATGIVYVSAPPIVLGLMATTTEVGIYSGADKLARVCVMMIGTLNIVVAPRIFSTMQTSSELAAEHSGRFMVVQAAITVPMSLVLYVFAPLIINLVLGPGYEDSVTILRLLAPVPVLIGLSSSLANQFLMTLSLDRQLGHLSLGCAIFYFAFLILMTHELSSVGAAISVLVVEVVTIVGSIIIVWRANSEYIRNAWQGARTFNLLEVIRPR